MDLQKADCLEIKTTRGSRDEIRIIRLSGPFTLQGVMDFNRFFAARTILLR